jgi:hypothetical protein
MSYPQKEKAVAQHVTAWQAGDLTIETKDNLSRKQQVDERANHFNRLTGPKSKSPK